MDNLEYAVLERGSSLALNLVVNIARGLGAQLVGGVATTLGATGSLSMARTTYAQAVLQPPVVQQFMDYWSGLERECLRKRKTEGVDTSAVYATGTSAALEAWGVAQGLLASNSGDLFRNRATSNKRLEMLKMLDDVFCGRAEATSTRGFVTKDVSILYGPNHIFYDEDGVVGCYTVAHYAKWYAATRLRG